MVSSRNNKRSGNKVVLNHRFNGCRDAVLAAGTGGITTSSYAVLQGASGATTNISFILAPLGLTSAKFGGSTVVAGGTGNVSAPSLRGLYNRAVDFQMYRVLQARFIFVGTVASNITGSITLYSYADVMDAANFTTSSLLSGPNTRTFDIASASTKELSIPMAIDSSWKKVSSILSVPGNQYPFQGADATSCATVNTVDDLAFGIVGASWSSGAAPGTTLGVFNVVYDVEFKGVVDTSVNL